MQSDKHDLFEEVPYQYYFRLFDRIEEVEQGGYVVNIKYMGMNDDGSVKDMPATVIEKLGYYMQQILSLVELGIEVGQDGARRCEQWNRLEVDDAIGELRETRRDLTRLPHSKDISFREVFIENVIGIYNGWFRDHGFEKPSLEGLPAAAVVSIPKKLRGPKDVGGFYVEAVKKYQKVKPTFKELCEVSQTSPATWHSDLKKPVNLLAIKEAVKKKLSWAKDIEKKELWEDVLADVDDSIHRLSNRMIKGKEKSVGSDIENFGADDEQFERID